MPELRSLLALRGNLSEELVASTFFTWWITQHVKTKCWLNHPNRNASRDRLFEKYLSSRGLGPNARAFILATTLTPALEVIGFPGRQDLELHEFLSIVKLAYADPVQIIMEVLTSAETNVKPLSGEFTEEHQASMEKNLELLVSIS